MHTAAHACFKGWKSTRRDWSVGGSLRGRINQQRRAEHGGRCGLQIIAVTLKESRLSDAKIQSGCGGDPPLCRGWLLTPDRHRESHQAVDEGAQWGWEGMATSSRCLRGLMRGVLLLRSFITYLFFYAIDHYQFEPLPFSHCSPLLHHH